MAVVDEVATVPLPGPAGRRQPREVVAVIDERLRGDVAGRARPGQRREAPAEEPVDEAPARRWPLSPETAGQADEQPQGEER